MWGKKKRRTGAAEGNAQEMISYFDNLLMC